jgi:UDPglucose--hexose-1-phosphate uridylyltransferase
LKFFTISKDIIEKTLAFSLQYSLNRYMADFKILANPVTEETVIIAPRRAKRTNISEGKPATICPFCVGNEAEEHELYRVGGKKGDSNWNIRVLNNKFPFASHHELIIHSPDHHKNIDELPFTQVELVLQTYRERFQAHAKKGQVYLFHNRGSEAGESLPHPHTQLTVFAWSVALDITPLDINIYQAAAQLQQKKGIFSLIKKKKKTKDRSIDVFSTEQFLITCPDTSEWPDEVWIVPKRPGKMFGQTTDKELNDLAYVLSRVIQLLDIRHGYEFPFNFYIYPGKNWYLRLVPRLKSLGGFEIGTRVMINTQDPHETFVFILEHFWQPDAAKIKSEQRADYWRGA